MIFWDKPRGKTLKMYRVASLHGDLEGDGIGLDDLAADDPVGDAEAPLEVGDVHEVGGERAPPAGRGRGHEEEEDGGGAKHDDDES